MKGRTTATPIITDPNHHQARAIRALRERRARDRAGLFYVEGARFVHQAVDAGAAVKALVVAPDALTGRSTRELVQAQRRAGVAMIAVSAAVLRSIGHAADAQGCGAVVRQRWTRLERLRQSDGSCWVAVETVQSPGNLGTILRTCEAVGAGGLICAGPDADPYDPACVRATMGSIFGVRLVRTSRAGLKAWTVAHGGLLVGAAPAATTDYRQITYPRGVVLAMGWERKGLSGEMLALCDRRVRIPMAGSIDSLNVSVATAVLLYEVFNQQRVVDGSD